MDWKNIEKLGKMEIVISGTKFGWCYFTDRKPVGLYDIGNGTGIKSITQCAYAIGYKNENCIFTKYRVVKDVRGDKRIGFVAFSLFLPFKEKLAGKDIKDALDRIDREYCLKYIPDGRNLEDIREDFSFLDVISADYVPKIKTNSINVNEEFQSGTSNAAFVYFPYIYKEIQSRTERKYELEDIFDEPYQEEYIPFRQVLFVNSDLRNSEESPLNALKNSNVDLTSVIDLKNEYYYLNNYNSSKGVRITANGKPRSESKGSNQIRAKWPVEIFYKREFYHPILATGSISDPGSDIFNYIELSGNTIRIRYDAFQPRPESKTYSVEVELKKDREKVNIAEIQVDTKPWEVRSSITFHGEEIGREHGVTARKGEHLVSDTIRIIPRDYPSSVIRLALIEKRTVRIKVLDASNGDVIRFFKVHVTGKDFYKVTDEIEFVGDDIEKVWNIQVEKRDGYLDSENRKFCPAKDGDEIVFKLKSKEKPSPGPVDSGTAQPLMPKPRRLFFTKLTPRAMFTLFFIFIVLVFGVFAFNHFMCSRDQSEKQPLTREIIAKYVEGDSLILSTLEDIKKEWKRKEQEFIKKSGGGWFGGNEKFDSSQWKKDWKPAYESLERAIEKRKGVEDMRFKELKVQRYSDMQQTFKNVLFSIDSNNYRVIRAQLGNVSKMTLTQIATAIKKINDSINNSNADKDAENVDEEKPETPSQKPVNAGEKPREEGGSIERPGPQERKPESTSVNNEEEIRRYIRGDGLTKAQLETYLTLQLKDRKLKNSIKLCLKLWSLDGTVTNSYDDFYKKIRKDVNLQTSELETFINCMKAKTSPTYVIDLRPDQRKKSLNEIKSILKCEQ